MTVTKLAVVFREVADNRAIPVLLAELLDFEAVLVLFQVSCKTSLIILL
jgi:hypothetical protein